VTVFIAGCVTGFLVALIVAVLTYSLVAKPRTMLLSAATPSATSRDDDERFSIVFNSAPVAIMLVRINDGRIIDVNMAFTELWGYVRAEALGRTGIELQLWIEPARLIEQLKQNRHADAHELKIRCKEGEIRDVLASVTMTHLDGGAHLLITAADLTERYRARQLEHLAHHDTLTQLPNRRMLWTALRDIGARTAENRATSAVLFLDLDRFKVVNDTLGHRAGDELLRLVAARLQRRLRTGDLLARIGGDEFVVVLENLQDRAQARVVANELMKQIARPFQLADRCEVHIGMSIGISYVTESAAELDVLLEQADAALYRAKETGRGGILEFEPRREMTEHAGPGAIASN
jgi:diguanylate cyclase (GGDEF)-like protein/PAS domain S-box-containing protein